MNINQPPTNYEGDMSGQFAVSDETFHQTLIAKQLPLSFDERLWLAHRELVIVEQILDTSKLSLDHPIYTYQLDSDSDTYRKLIHFRSLLKKKTGILGYEYVGHIKSCFVLACKAYLLSFYDNDPLCKTKGARMKNNPGINLQEMERDFLRLISNYDTYQELNVPHFQFKIESSRVYYQSMIKTCARNLVTKAYQIDTFTHPIGYYYLDFLKCSEQVLDSILDRIC